MKRHTQKAIRADLFSFIGAALAFLLQASVLSAQPAAGEGKEKESPSQSNGTKEAEKAAPKPRVYSFAEIEELLEEVRKKRQDDPVATHSLIGWYDRMSKPRFTNSKDIAEHCTKLAAWRKEKPQSPTPLIVLAKAQMDYAWQARGSGFANTVTKEGWELFHTRFAEAHRLLEEAVKLGVKDGEAYRCLIDVAKAEGLSKVQTRALLDQGMKIDAKYMEMYTSMAQYLLPRWHGEPGDVEKFASEMAEKIGGDDGLEACGMIAYVVNKFESENDSTLFFGQYDRKMLVKATELVAKRYPQSRSHVQFAALCTVAAQDHEAARRLRPIVGDYNEADGIWDSADELKDYLDWCEKESIPRGEEEWAWGSRGYTPGFAFAANPRFIWCAHPGGRWAAVLTDAQTGKLRLSIPNPGGRVKAIAFCNSRKWVVTAQKDEADFGWVLWDFSPDTKPAYHPTDAPCSHITIHPKLPQIAWVESKSAKLFDIETEKTAAFELPATALAMTYSADGSRLAVQTGDGLVVIDVAAEKKKHVLTGYRSLIGFDSANRVLAIDATDGTKQYEIIRFADDGQSRETWITDVGWGVGALSPDGRFLALTDSRLVHRKFDIWQLSSKQKIKHFDGHLRRIDGVTFSDDGKKIATVSEDGLIKNLAAK